jgi:enamine deaminase RidA (YjgF/YER057c/UK114 family)
MPETNGREPKRQEFSVAGMNLPISHYTDAVRFGDIVFLSGVGPLEEDLSLVGGDDVVAQARKTHENLGYVLEALGASFADVLKVTVYLTDVGDRTAINPVRQEFFGEARPASTLIGVNELAIPGMKLEIEAVVGLPH